MLKTSEPRKDGDGVGGDSKAGRDRIDRSGIDDIEVDGSEVEVDEIRIKARNLSNSKSLSKSKKTVGSDFLIPGAKLAFTKFRQAFLKVLILHHFDPEHHIRIETDVSGYAIGGVFSQLTLDDLGR